MQQQMQQQQQQQQQPPNPDAFSLEDLNFDPSAIIGETGGNDIAVIRDNTAFPLFLKC